MDTIVTRKDGKKYTFSELGIRTLDFRVSFPPMRHEFETLEGRHGVIDLGSVRDAGLIECDFHSEAYDLLDFALLRNEIYQMFNSVESFYIQDSREKGKRYEVKVESAFTIEQILTHGLFSVSFIVPSGFAESVGTTQDPLTFPVEKWQVGQGLLLEEPKYTHNTSEFHIFNASSVMLDPREHEMLIELKGNGAFPSITNRTTGDTWEGYFTLTQNQTLELDGVRALRNRSSVFSETNRELIRLAPGWNDIKITGMEGTFEVKFIFRFLY